MKISGNPEHAAEAKRVFSELLTLSERGNAITGQNVDYILSLALEKSPVTLTELDKDCVGFTVQGKPIKPKTHGQQNYVNLIREKMMVFGVGPAGTGKTYLAMAMAIHAFTE